MNVQCLQALVLRITQKSPGIPKVGHPVNKLARNNPLTLHYHDPPLSKDPSDYHYYYLTMLDQN